MKTTPFAADKEARWLKDVDEKAQDQETRERVLLLKQGVSWANSGAFTRKQRHVILKILADFAEDEQDAIESHKSRNGINFTERRPD